MSGSSRPLVVIVSAVVGGLILVWMAGEGLAVSGLFSDVPHVWTDYLWVVLYVMGACLAFASAGVALVSSGFAGTPALVAGVFAGLAILPPLAHLVAQTAPELSEVAEQAPLLYGGYGEPAVLAVGTAATGQYLFFLSAPCALAAMLCFRRWYKGRTS